MAEQKIDVDGKEVVVREDTARAFRGTHWALLSLGAIILIAALMFLGGFFKLATGPSNSAASPTPVAKPGP